MNNVELIGRLVKDPDVKYVQGSSGQQTAIATFTLAIDRPPRKDGGEKQADFPRITVFGKQAETCQKYLKKGRMVAIQGRLQTGSYQDKNGNTVYTTDVVASRIEFIDWGRENAQQAAPAQGYQQTQAAPQYPTPQPGYTAQPPVAPAPAPVQPVQQYQPAPAPETPMPDSFAGIDEDVPF